MGDSRRFRDILSEARTPALGAMEDFVRALAHQIRVKSAQVQARGGFTPADIEAQATAAGDTSYALRLDGAEATLRYSPPESIAGQTSEVAGSWSLGIILLEWWNGTHPFGDSTDSAVRQLVATTWRPTPNLPDPRWRALLWGLLERSPTTRWRDAELDLWLNGDLGIVSNGLALGGQAYAQRPWQFAGYRVHTAESLARALLSSWQTAQIQSDELLTWLGSDLDRPDLAAALRRIRADQSLNIDCALLRFCHMLHSPLPAVWRGWLVSGDVLDQRARHALLESAAEEERADAGRWLQSLRGEGGFAFFRAAGDESVAALETILEGSLAGYNHAWQRILDAGAPAIAPLPEGVLLPTIVRASFSRAMRDDLRRYADELAHSPFLLSIPWVGCLGTEFAAMPPSHLLALRQFLLDPQPDQQAEPESRLRVWWRRLRRRLGRGIENEGATPEGPEALLRGFYYSRLQRRLASWFRIRPGVEPQVLQPGEVYPESAIEDRENERREAHRGEIRDVLRLAVIQLWARIVGGFRAVVQSRPFAQTTNDALSGYRRRWQLPQMSVRLLDFDNADQDLPIRAYWVMVSWTHSANFACRLHIEETGSLFTRSRLKSPWLTASGDYLFVVVKSCRISMSISSGHWYLPNPRTQQIRLWLAEPRALVRANENLVPAKTAALRAAKTKLLKVTKLAPRGVDRLVRSHSLPDFGLTGGRWRKRLRRGKRKQDATAHQNPQPWDKGIQDQ